MNNSDELPTEWTDKQRAAFAALKASFERSEASKLNARNLLNKAPKDGWTDADRIAK